MLDLRSSHQVNTVTYRDKHPFTLTNWSNFPIRLICQIVFTRLKFLSVACWRMAKYQETQKGHLVGPEPTNLTLCDAY